MFITDKTIKQLCENLFQEKMMICQECIAIKKKLQAGKINRNNSHENIRKLNKNMLIFLSASL